MRVVERNNMIIVNTTSLCQGVITRERITDKVFEQSTIDYVIVCQKMFSFLTKMTIDEARAHVLTKFAKNDGEDDIKDSISYY